MANHVLSLEIPDTLNKCVLRIMDLSVYNSRIPIDCQKLHITVPGFSTAVEIINLPDVTDLAPGFNINLTACNLGIQTVNCGQIFASIPDGVYVVRYSVSPNDIVYVEYNHLRITQALTKYQQVLCSLDVAGCDPPAQTKEKLKELRFIREMLDAAKAQVEFCHNPQRGLDIYSYALKRLNKLLCISC